MHGDNISLIFRFTLGLGRTTLLSVTDMTFKRFRLQEFDAANDLSIEIQNPNILKILPPCAKRALCCLHTVVDEWLIRSYLTHLLLELNVL